MSTPESTCSVCCIFGITPNTALYPRAPTRKLYGYRSPFIATELLIEPDKLPEDCIIIVLVLRGMDGLATPAASSFSRLPPNSFVELRLTPSHGTAGSQLQRSEVKSQIARPRFENPAAATYEFLVSRSALAGSKIILSCYHHAHRAEPVLLGDAVLHCKDITAEAVRRSLKLHTDAGAQGIIDITMSLRTPDEHCLEKEHVVYEFERWRPMARDWGHDPAHASTSDPGRWATLDGLTWGNDIEVVAPEVPASYKIDHSWRILATAEDPDGWEYATDPFSSRWWPKSEGHLDRLSLVVRRRTMNRRISLNL